MWIITNLLDNSCDRCFKLEYDDSSGKRWSLSKSGYLTPSETKQDVWRFVRQYQKNIPILKCNGMLLYSYHGRRLKTISTRKNNTYKITVQLRSFEVFINC